MAIQSPDRTEAGRNWASPEVAEQWSRRRARRGEVWAASCRPSSRSAYSACSRKLFTDAGFQHIAVHAASLQRHFPSVAIRLA
jgi:hypothetical protein